MTADGVVEARDDCGRRTSLRGESDAGPKQGEDAGDEWADDYGLRTPCHDTGNGEWAYETSDVKSQSA